MSGVARTCRVQGDCRSPRTTQPLSPPRVPASKVESSWKEAMPNCSLVVITWPKEVCARP